MRFSAMCNAEHKYRHFAPARPHRVPVQHLVRRVTQRVDSPGQILVFVEIGTDCLSDDLRSRPPQRCGRLSADFSPKSTTSNDFDHGAE